MKGEFIRVQCMGYSIMNGHFAACMMGYSYLPIYVYFLHCILCCPALCTEQQPLRTGLKSCRCTHTENP